MPDQLPPQKRVALTICDLWFWVWWRACENKNLACFGVAAAKKIKKKNANGTLAHQTLSPITQPTVQPRTPRPWVGMEDLRKSSSACL